MPTRAHLRIVRRRPSVAMRPIRRAALLHDARFPFSGSSCLDGLREELTPQQFNTWIRPLAVEGGDGGYQALGTQPLRAAVGQGALRAAASRAHAAAEATVAIRSRSPSRDVPDRRARGRHSPAHRRRARLRSRARAASRRAGAASPARRNEQTSLNPTFTFASFVAGKANQLARGRGHAGRRAPDLVQPAVRLRRRRPRQDAPDPGDRQPHPAARSGARRSATSTPRPTCPTSCAPTSTRRSTTSSATTARSTSC